MYVCKNTYKCVLFIFHRYSNLEKEHQRTVETNEQEMRTLKNKMEASLEFMKQEHNIAAAKVNKNNHLTVYKF